MKVLKGSTIIPQELYVHRDADRQIRRGLEDMGRPAYVLVARQMGKTNLLLNARRELRRAEDVFVYIDLSNPFESTRAYLRNTIDSAIESAPEYFDGLAPDVDAIRSRDLVAHKEHELELRLLLSRIRGKLVIILDEIDSLTTSPFSDQVFAQIRSAYFSRTNIAAYERLTYLLSGVADPSELIKNPKLSPFNIGEKVFLDDFTEAEFRSFVLKAGLGIDEAVQQEIYRWVRGNPRMTWDVCSELEDIVLSGQIVTVSQVQTTVEKLYLNSFDRPPVDHIRTIVENSPELRNALVEIRYGKGGAISDAARAKLYLSGIIASNPATVKIKNPVVDRCLSEQWLADITRKKLGLLKAASEGLSRGQYREAIALADEFLLIANAPPLDRLVALNVLGTANYELGRYDESERITAGALVDRAQNALLYFEQRFRQALCQFHLGRYAECILIFEEVIASCPDPWKVLLSRVNLASARSRVDGGDDREAIATYESVLSEISGTAISAPTRDVSSLKVRLQYNLSIALERLGDVTNARARLAQCLDDATRTERAVLLIELAQLTEAVEEKSRLVTESIEIVVGENLRPVSSPKNSAAELTQQGFASLLVLAFSVGAFECFFKLIEYCLKLDGESPSSGTSMTTAYTAFAATVYAQEGNEALAKIRGVLGSRPHLLNSVFEHEVLRGLTHQSLKEEGTDLSGEYLKELAGSVRPLDRIDLSILSRVLGDRLQKGAFAAANAILTAIKPHRLKTPAGDLLILTFYDMLAVRAIGDYESERRIARQILDTIDERSEPPAKGSVTKSIREAAASALADEVPADVGAPRRASPKIGRNETVRVRYSDEKTVVGKYKRLKADLDAGKCVLVPPEV